MPKSKERELEDYLEDSYPVQPGLGYVVSARLCIMNSSGGFVLCARMYQDAFSANPCGPDDEDAEDTDPVILEPLPNLEALKAFENFLRIARQ